MDYDSSRYISAIVTLLVIAIIFRIYLRYVMSKRPKIQKPDDKKKFR